MVPGKCQRGCWAAVVWSWALSWPCPQAQAADAFCCTLQCTSSVSGPPSWLQLYDLGDKRELLVTAQLEDPSNPDSTVTVDMTTTLPEGGERPLLRPSCAAAVCGSGCASKAAVHGGHVVEGRSMAGIMLAGRSTACWQTTVVKNGNCRAVTVPPPTHPSTRLTRPSQSLAAVLHWGVRQAGRGSDWLQPPLKLLTPTTTLPMGGKSAETPFLSCKGGFWAVGPCSQLCAALVVAC